VSKHKSRAVFRRALVGGLLCGAGLLASVSHAVVTSSGLGTQVNVVGTDYNITGGARPNNGTTLFHSFGDFSLGTPESANFLNDSPGLATANILSRVTGGNPSNIFGTIDTSGFPGANLFLMNPAGILFGPTAQLNVAGSFHATTADYIGLADGTHFNAIPSAGADALLTAAAPSAFGFLNSNPAPIDVQAGTFDLISTFQFTNVFQVPEGQTLSFVGGDLNVGSPDLLPPGAPPAPGGFVFAPGGIVNLVSVASPGEATFDNSTITVDGFAQLGNINIMGGGIVDGKEVFIRGGQLTVQDATVFPGLFWLAGEPVAPPDGGGVNIEVSGAVNITSVVGPILTFPGIETQGGSTAGVVLGDVPDIKITAGSLSVSDGGRILSTRLGPGNPPDLLIQANTVEVRNGSAISLVNLFEGPGGTLTVNAHDVTLDSEGSAGITGLQAQSNFNPAYGQPGVPYLPFFQDADSGSITVNAEGQLTVLNRAQISADSFAFGQGGSVTVNAGDMLLVGAGTNTAAITSQSGLGGQSGDVTVNAARTIDMQNGFRISANTFGSGDGGAVNVTAGQSITMSGDFTQISSATDQPLDSNLNGFAEKFGGPGYDYSTLRADLGIAPATGDLMQVLEALNGITDFAGFPLVILTDFTPGDAGQVSVATPALNVTNDAVIQTSTAWDGNAGAITLNIGSLSLENGGSVRSRNGNVRLDRGPTVGTGNAGKIDVTATDTISISGRSPTTGESSFISTSTFGDGNAGNISLSASEVNVQNGGSVTSESGGMLGNDFLVGTGNAGTVTITATGPNTLTISGAGSTVSTSTSGAGAGGSILLSSAGDVQILGGGLVSADSLSTDLDAGDTGDITITADNSITLSNGTISTQAVQADGGNIKLTAPNIVQLTGSDITTSIFKEGGGNGGNINIDPEFVTFNKSQVIANAFTGTGGNIQITAANFIPSADSVVDASSQFGVQGTIVIQSPENDIAGSISQLPQSIVDVSGLLPESCAARHAGGRELSSFVVAGRGGLPTNPDNYLPSFGAGSAPMKSGGTAAPGMSLSDLGYANQTTVAMAGWGCLP
jgi:filamentous hemagglutinin family protein